MDEKLERGASLDLDKPRTPLYVSTPNLGRVYNTIDLLIKVGVDMGEEIEREGARFL